MAQQDVKPAPIRKADKSTWPPGVRAITADELEAIGVDHRGDLYWHGKHVQVRHPLVLNFWHTLLATGTALSAIALGLIEAIRFCLEIWAR
ncbi:hypothetical protein [Taklimakanibacter lacteus]|uniref:hypothetical protein n=1 Tax=Taklimakanibacter lacteus TaxID=2268456 RepID=UPI0013C4D4FE